MKKDYFTHSFQKKKKTNKQEIRKRKKNGRKRKSRRCLHQFVGRKTIFVQRHHNKQAKMRKLEKTFFKTQKNKTKCGKNMLDVCDLTPYETSRWFELKPDRKNVTCSGTGRITCGMNATPE